MEIKLREGIGELKFGLQLEEVVKILGVPDEEYDTREEYIRDYLKDCEIWETPKYTYLFGDQRGHIVCKYHDEKMIMSFEPDCEFGLCYFYTANEYITYNGNSIMGGDINLLMNTVFNKQNEWEIEVNKRGDLRTYYNYKLDLKLYAYKDKITCIEFEAPYSHDYGRFMLEEE